MKLFKALAKYQKVAHGRPFKGNNMLYYYVTLLKIDQIYSLLSKSSWKWSLVNR